MNRLHATAVLTALATSVPCYAVAQLTTGLDVETVIGTEVDKSVQYAAKFVCGLPPGDTGAFIGPVTAGFYLTSINIYNPNSASVTANLRVLEVSAAGGGNPGHRTATGSEMIGANSALKIDCFDVAQFFGQSSVTNSEGFVVITVDKRTVLNVVGVYTAQGGT
jgi:hypothetical protein